MPSDRTLLDLAESQYGLITATQLRSLGFPPQAFARRAASRHWTPLTDEVLQRVGAPQGRGTIALAAVLDAGPGAVLSHSSAASWWGLGMCRLSPTHVARTSRSTRIPRVDELHVVRELLPAYLTQLDRVPIVRPELLALQLYAQFHEGRAERMVDALWSRRLLSGHSIERCLDRVGRRGRNGTAGLRRYLAERGAGYVPPASGLEGRARRTLAEAGLTMRVEVDSGAGSWVGRVDLRHEHLPVIVEIQSERYHSALCDKRADARRRERLEAAGFVVLEVWEDTVWSRPAEMVRQVRAAIRSVRRNEP